MAKIILESGGLRSEIDVADEQFWLCVAAFNPTGDPVSQGTMDVAVCKVADFLDETGFEYGEPRLVEAKIAEAKAHAQLMREIGRSTQLLNGVKRF